MPLDLIDHAPILEEDFPLFSWDDFPQSRDSLVSGMPVALFEADCWDSMVSTLEFIVLELGYSSWADAPYFSGKWDKMFTAQMYRAMRSALRTIFPFCSGDPEGFSIKGGLVRDEDFYPSPGDPLTPDYLKFIARWLNTIIAVSRGSIGLIKPELYSYSDTKAIALLERLNSVPVVASAEQYTKALSNVELLPSLPTGETARGSFSHTSFDIILRDSVELELNRKTKTKRYAEAHKLPSVPGTVKAFGKSISNASILMTSLSRFQTDARLKTLCKALVSAMDPEACEVSYSGRGYSVPEILIKETLLARSERTAKTSASIKAGTAEALLSECKPVMGKSVIVPEVSANDAEFIGNIRANGRSFPQPKVLSCGAANVAGNTCAFSNVDVPSIVTDAEVAEPSLGMFSDSYVNVITQTTRPAWTSTTSTGNASAEVENLEAKNVVLNHSGIANAGCNLELISAANVETNTLTFGAASCDAAVFLLPLQPDSKTLFIRQTYQDALKLDDMLYIDQWPDQGLTDDGTLFLWRIYDTIMHVGNTLYIGTMPDTGMTDSDTLLIWDVEQEPVKTLKLLEVF